MHWIRYMNERIYISDRDNINIHPMPPPEVLTFFRWLRAIAAVGGKDETTLGVGNFGNIWVTMALDMDMFFFGLSTFDFELLGIVERIHAFFQHFSIFASDFLSLASYIKWSNARLDYHVINSPLGNPFGFGDSFRFTISKRRNTNRPPLYWGCSCLTPGPKRCRNGPLRPIFRGELLVQGV